MTGRFVHVPHVHSGPPLLESVFAPIGTIWECSCGLRYTRIRRKDGGNYWHAGPLPIASKEYTDDLAGALAFIRDEANRHRRALGLRSI